jgi:hypothetical protein
MEKGCLLIKNNLKMTWLIQSDGTNILGCKTLTYS